MYTKATKYQKMKACHPANFFSKIVKNDQLAILSEDWNKNALFDIIDMDASQHKKMRSY